MILVTFAVPQESRAFAGLLQHGGPLGCGFVGNLESEEVAIVHTGMGRAATAKAIEQAIAEFRPARVISSGFAGALAPHLATEAMVAAANFSSAELLARLAPSVERAEFTCAEVPLDTPAEKAQCRAETGADVVDLESSPIVQACVAAGIPRLVLRVISDSASESLPLPSPVAFDLEQQRIRPFAILQHLAENLSAIPPLVRFTRRLPSLQRTLADALAAAIREDGPV